MIENRCTNVELEPYKCKNCYFSTPFLMNLKEHSQPPHEVITRTFPKHSCRDCLFATFSSLTFLGHLQLHKTNNSKTIDGITWYECQWCKHKTQTTKHLKEHIKAYHLKLRLKCPKCDFTSEDKRSFDGHQKENHGVTKNGRAICEICNKSFHCLVRLRRHLQLTHLPDEAIVFFNCQKCDYKGKTEEYLKRHLKTHLPEEERKALQCPECSYKTEFQSRLKQHQKYVHAGEQRNPRVVPPKKWLQCDKCPYKTPFKRNFDNHVLFLHASEQGIKLYICDECKFTAKTAKILRKHARNAHTPLNEIKWFQCNQCEVKMKYKDSLKKHIQSKHAVKRFECDSCEFKSEKKVPLKKHIQSKHGAIRMWHQCRRCIHKAKSAEALKRHVNRAHPTTLNRYQCRECNFKTTDNWILTAHIRNKHPEDKK